MWKASDAAGALADGTYVGEFMYGSNWSQQNDRNGHFYAFDLLREGDREVHDEPYHHRLERLKGLSRWNPSGCTGCRWVSVAECYGLSHSYDLWRDFVEGDEDGEGLIFRNRKHDWYGGKVLKVKQEPTYDWVVMGVTEGVYENHTDMLGGLELGMYVDGELTHLCDCGNGFSHPERKALWTVRDSLIGRVIEVKGKRIFKGGALRHPQVCRWNNNQIKWRDDKLPRECVLPDKWK